MFSEKLLIALKCKRSKELMPDPRIVPDVKIFPTDKTFTHLTRNDPMIKDVFYLVPRTTVHLNLYGLNG